MVAMTWLLAEGTPIDWPMEAIGNVTATAMLGWYAWHTATKTIPVLVQNFREELAAERSANRQDREAFFSELSQERTQRHTDQAAIASALVAISSQLGEREKRG